LATRDIASPAATGTQASYKYQTVMVVITSLVIAFLATDRLATGYIGPFLTQDLDLSATQLGLLYSAQAVTVAISGIAIGHFSDRTGMRKRLLVPLLAFCALAASATLLAEGYLQLMAVRVVMGAALGGLTPIVQSIVSAQSTRARLGFHIGIQTLLMFLISQMAGPLISTRLAAAFGWQTTYAASAVPFVLLAVLVAILLRENPRVEAGGDGSDAAVRSLPASANHTIGLRAGPRRGRRRPPPAPPVGPHRQTRNAAGRDADLDRRSVGGSVLDRLRVGVASLVVRRLAECRLASSLCRPSSQQCRFPRPPGRDDRAHYRIG
jgi:MFS family permease